MRWDLEDVEKKGVVVAGGHGFGDGPHQLACPGGIHVTDGGVLYVSDEANDRVMRWRKGAKEGETVAGGNGPGSGSAQLYHPLGLYVNEKEDALFIADSLNYRIQRWPLFNKATSPGLDRSHVEHVENETVGETVAGGQRGAGEGEMGQPMSVLLDEIRGCLYVSDSDNGRIQCYPHEIQEHTAEVAPFRAIESAPRIEGLVTEYRAGGYGFILDSNRNKYFVHHSDIRVPSHPHSSPLFGYPQLKKGESVTFEPRPDAKWQRRAALVTAPAD